MVKKIVPKVPTNGGEIGNTSQISPAIRWCFTLNNYSDDQVKLIRSILSDSSKFYIFGFEVGEEGTPHLQGYVEFKKKVRPRNIICKEIHWEKARFSKAINKTYCSKDGHYWIDGVEVKPIKIITNLYDWQSDIVKILEADADDRTINWICESTGNVGKSALVKYICVKNKTAIVVSGKSNDMKNAILMFNTNNGYFPKIIIVDMPRSYNSDYLNISTLEEIKNGCFYSGKYEGGMCVFNCPHVLVFSNAYPDTDLLSTDRWNIITL